MSGPQPVTEFPTIPDMPHYVRLKKEHGGTIYPSCRNPRVEPREAHVIPERKNLQIAAGFDLIFTAGVSPYLPAEQRVDCAAIDLVIPPVEGFPTAAELGGTFEEDGDEDRDTSEREQLATVTAERDMLAKRLDDLEELIRAQAKAPRAPSRARARTPKPAPAGT